MNQEPKCWACGRGVDSTRCAQLGEKNDALKLLSVLPRQPEFGICFYCLNAATLAAIEALDARREGR